MGLLVSFFVMLVAFSTQDQAKLQVVAGSMRDAFGVQDRVRYSGIIEVLGLPTRPKEASATPSPEENDRQRSYGARFKEDRKFSLASASLRQTLQEMPEITEVSKHTSCSRKRSRDSTSRLSTRTDVRCFPTAQKSLLRIIQKIAPQLEAIPYRLSIVGHTASSKVPPKPGYGPWELSADRANALRQILEAEGVPPGNIFMVAGKADTDPLFPDDSSMSPNRRVTITLMKEEPPLPANLTP